MKKSILLFAVALGMLTACDPIKEDGTFDVDNYTSSNLLDGAEFSQYADQACTTPQADGNYIKYNIPNASGIYIYYIKADGSEFKLTSGASGGVFNFVPARGSDPNQTVYFKYIDANNQEVVASKEFNVAVAAELKPEVRLIASNAYGKKTWTWNTHSGISAGGVDNLVWGNFGADGSWRGETLNDFVWWGVNDAADLKDQLGHSVTGAAIGEEDNGATMVFTEDGLVKCYDANGTEIRSGSYEIKGWTGENHDGFKYGILHTSEGATLFPYEINAGGRYVTDYWIYSLTSDNLVLVYPDNGAFSGWSEGTYWAFKSESDVSGMMNNYGSKTWTWDTESGISAGGVDNLLWGNFGADGTWRNEDFASCGFTWWGVNDASQLKDQLGHSVTGSATGEEDNAATMVLNEDGSVKCYDANGTEIRSGSYEIDLSTADVWKKGTFKTTEGATLFPYEINAGGRYVTDFQIYSISDSKMVLTYPDNGAFSGWSEGTYWAFKKK